MDLSKKYFNNFFLNEKTSRIDFFIDKLSEYYTNSNFVYKTNIKSLYITFFQDFTDEKIPPAFFTGDILDLVYFLKDVEMRYKSKAMNGKNFTKSMDIQKSSIYVQIEDFLIFFLNGR